MKTPQEMVAFVRSNPVGFGCGAVILVFSVLFYLRGADMPEAARLLEERSREGARLAANVRNGAHLPEQFAAVAAAGKEIDSRLVRPTELAQNLQYFYKLEAETAVKLTDLRQLTTTAKTKPGTTSGVAFSVTVQGDYLAVMDFLRRLEQGTHYCRIMSASISPSGPERSSPIVMALGVELLGRS